MQPRRTMTIEGPITLLSPLHISMPGSASYDRKNNKLKFGDDPGMSPVTMTRVLNVLAPEQDQDGRATERIPVIPANGWRGRLRRAAANVIEEHIAGLEERLSFDAYQSMHSGAINGAIDGTPVRLNEAASIRNHCFAGLFGGGARMIPSNYKASNGYPILSHLIDTGVVPDAAREHLMRVSTGDVWRTLFDYTPIARVDDVMQMRDPDFEMKLDPAEVQQKMLEALDARADKKKRKAEVEPVAEESTRSPLALQFLSYMEVVTTGTCFWQKFTLDATDAQVGLFLLALGRLSRATMGGKSAAGNGEFACRFTARLDGEQIGEVVNSADGLAFSNPHIKELVDAAEKEIATLTPASLSALFAPAKTADKKPAKD